MKVFITINKCDEKDCSEIAPAFCDECGAQAEADIKKGKVTNMKVKMENKR